MLENLELPKVFVDRSICYIGLCTSKFKNNNPVRINAMNARDVIITRTGLDDTFNPIQ